ncbi:unnamed protein product, partial [Medioppia subpectinata]
MISALKQIRANKLHKYYKSVFIKSFESSKTEQSMDLSTNAKRFCPEAEECGNGRARVGTHDGIFHCDEILACFLLKQLSQYSNAQIIRTRDESVLKELDVVVDVGGVYDANRHRYDHHQRDFTHTLSSILT